MAPSSNVAPTQHSVIVRRDAKDRRLATARWGLAPAWADDLSFGNRCINARAETISTTAAYRSAFKNRRCIVPVSGFYEWQKRGDGTKQPWYIHRADGEILCLAGVWERRERDGTAVESFSIVTTSANAAIASLHDRMPVVLEREEIDRWLDPQTPQPELLAMLDPAPDGVLAFHTVSTRVNNARVDEPGLTEPIAT